MKRLGLFAIIFCDVAIAVAAERNDEHLSPAAKSTIVEIGREYGPDDNGPAGCHLVAREECGVPDRQPHKARGRDGGPGSQRAYNVADNWDRAVVYRFEGLDAAARYKLRVVLLSGPNAWLHIAANRNFLHVPDPKTKQPTSTIPMPAEKPMRWEFDLDSSWCGGGSLELRFSNREGWPAVVSQIELRADRPVMLKPAPLPPLPDYETLAASAWHPLRFENRPFFFMCYDKVSLHKKGNVHGRFAMEAARQRVLSPVWEFENFSLAGDRWTGVAEWGYNTSLDGECKPDCYESRRRWYCGKLADARAAGNFFGSFTGHGWLEPYAAQWGADLITTELGAGSPCVQARVALLRGAARQNRIPYVVQTSPWYGGSIPYYEADESEEPRRPGHSAAFQARTWFLAWLAGAAFTTPEACQLSFFRRLPEQKGTKPFPPVTRDQPEEKRFKLSPIGRKAHEFVRHIERHPDAGVPYTPFALIMDQFAGFQVTPGAGQVRPWWRLEPTPGDLEMATVLDTVFPRTVLYRHGDRFSESRLMVNAPYGESFDILLSTVRPELLRLYPAALLLGDHELTPAFRRTLLDYLRHGGHLVVTQRLAGQLGADTEAFRRAGRFSIEEFARDGRSVHELMDLLATRHLPLKIEGNIQFAINRTARGWLVGLLENRGAYKEESGEVIFNPALRPTITIAPKRERLLAAQDWTGQNDLAVSGGAVSVSVPPGGVRVVELVVEPL